MEFDSGLYDWKLWELKNVMEFRLDKILKKIPQKRPNKNVVW